MLERKRLLCQLSLGNSRQRYRFWRHRSTAALAAILIALTISQGSYSMPTQNASQLDPRLLDIPSEYFSIMGPKFNVHFTMHHLSGSGTLTSTEEPLDPTVSTIDELVREIERKIPGARVVIDRHDKDHPVIHVIDKAAAKKSNVLERRIDLDWSGVVGQLAGELEDRGVPGIEGRLSGFGSEGDTDHITEVDIAVKQQPIRDILTHSVDMDSYYWVIWNAKTYQAGDGSWRTQIRFTRSMTKDSDR